MDDAITPKQFQDSEGVGDWHILSDGANAFFRTSSFAEASQFVAAIAGLQGVEGHPPAVDLRARGVTVRLVSADDSHYGMSERDVDLARRISDAARTLGLSADPSAVQSLLVVPGATDIRAVMPFWRAALGYEPRADNPDEDLVDPQDRGIPLWFEGMEQPRGDGLGAVHIAVWVPLEQAEQRVAAALAAGGRVVRNGFAPMWWTLADAAGNEVDIATVAGRD